MATEVNFPTKFIKTPPQAGKKGGSSLGKMLGAIAGIGAGIALAAGTGGAGAPLAAGAVGAGAGAAGAAGTAGAAALATAGTIGGLGAAGGGLGGLAGGIINKAERGRSGSISQVQGQPVQGSSPIQRRQQIQEQSPLLSLKSALESLPQAPPELQQQALQPLLQAYSIEKQRGGRA